MDAWMDRSTRERERETEERPFSWLTRGRRIFISLSRGAAGLEHYIRSFIRDELQLPVLFTRNEIEFYPPSSPEGEYFTMINDLCRQHAPFFFSPPPLSSIFLHYVRDTWEQGNGYTETTRQPEFSLFSFLFRQFLPATIMLMKPNPRPYTSVNRSRGNNIVPRLIDPGSEMTRVLNMHYDALVRKI